MHHHHNRTMSIKKSDLIDKIRANKEKHIKDYEEAVIAYRKEAAKQLKEQQEKLERGDLDLKLNLVTPVNCAADYDKVIEMFGWEVDEIISLTQKEFNEYVHDETSYALAAKFSNSTYR